MTTFIYALCDPDTGMVRYVGKSDIPEIRYKHHLIDNRKTHKVNWINNLKDQNKYPTLKILEEVNHSVWEESEIKWIAHYRKESGEKLTNATKGGEHPHHTPESIRKMSLSKMGHKVSEETRRKMSKPRPDPEYRKKLSEIHKKLPINPRNLECLKAWREKNKGKPLSEEHRRKIALANTGKTHSPETRTKLAQATKAHMNLPQIKKRQAENCRRQWSNPEYQIKRSEETKKLWKNPEFRAKRAEAQKRYQATKKQEILCHM